MKPQKVWIAQYRMLVIVAAVLLAVAVPAVAYFIRNSGTVTNTFTPAVSVQPQINETFVNNVKSNVSFKVGKTNYPVYVRAAIIVTWQKANGTVYFQAPVEGTDYTLTLNTTDWEKRASTVDQNQSYYYLKNSVKSEGVTPTLIVNCTPKSSAPPADGYTLNVDVLVQTVQAVGYTDGNGTGASEIPAYMDAWGLKKPLDN